MTNARKILIVDDDAELRDALVEQLALHEEFDSIAVDSGTKGVQPAKVGQIDQSAGCRPARSTAVRRCAFCAERIQAPIITLTATPIRHNPG